jgi:hypothetical protein
LGLEFIALPAAGLVVLCVALAFFLIHQSQNHERDSLVVVWGSYARQRGAKLEGSQIVSRDPAGESWAIQAIHHHGERCTKASLRIAVPLLGEVRVVGVPNLAGSNHEGSGDPVFDAYFSIMTASSVASLQVLDANMRRALARFHMNQLRELRYARGSVSVVWSGWETNAARLDEAMALLRLKKWVARDTAP